MEISVLPVILGRIASLLLITLISVVIKANTITIAIYLPRECSIDRSFY